MAASPCAVGDLRVGLGDVGREQGHQAQPAGQQFGSGGGQVAVPDVERAHVTAAATDRRAGGLQQGVALAHDTLVVGPHAGEPGRARDEQVVQEPAAAVRVALDERQVLRREQHRPEHPEDLPGPGDRPPVEPGPVGPARDDLDLDQRVASRPPHHGADDGTLRPQPDQGRVGGDAVAAQGRHVADGLDEVRLALPVGTDERRHPLVERELRRRVGPEIGDREVGDAHESYVSGSRRCRTTGRRSPRARRRRPARARRPPHRRSRRRPHRRPRWGRRR